MSSPGIPMDKLNLICANCDHQFEKGDLRSINKSDFHSFVDDFTCPNCRDSIHPEDALINYLRRISTPEVPGRPVNIGGFASVGTTELDVGKTEEVPLIGGGGLEIDLELLAETDQPPGQTIRDLQGVQLEWFPGPILVENESVVVHIVQASDTEIAYITSERNSGPSSVTVAYLYHARRSGIPQPPWVTLLNDAIGSYHRGHELATFSLLFSSLENLLSRELSRTLRARGWADSYIDDFLGRDCYWTWEDRIKGGVQTASSKHFPTEFPALYQDLYDLRKTRNDEIIHVDRGGSVANISIPELKKSVSTIVDAVIGVNELCHEARMNYT